ncbi:SPTBN1 [Branchiostoma lanceolatum]|uniref:SPTBN1 protein n=1 Tax=Branchiostoma lanceolatum TaxID=7740 RepID=A0A8J9Z3V5_BRALA|nr:SPTBN1 [Branchiostoma lanceolatum]
MATSSFSSILQVYQGWANSVLCEGGYLIEDLTELQNGALLCCLVDILTGSHLTPTSQISSPTASLENVEKVLSHLRQHGIKLNVTARGVVCGELKSLLDVVWALILHYTVHSKDGNPFQRTVRVGKRLLLEWCCTQLPDMPININGSMAYNYSKHPVLTRLIGKYCCMPHLGSPAQSTDVMTLTNAVLAAEEKFGVSKLIVSPSEILNGTADDHALMIYTALLRRKISLLQEDPSVLAQAGRILLADAPKLLPSTQPQSHPTGAERAASPPKRPGEGGRPIQVLLEQQAKQQASIKLLREQLKSLESFKQEALQSFTQSPNSSVASLSKHLDPSLPRSTPTLSSEFSPIRSPNSSLVGSPQSRSRGVSPQRGSETNLYHSSPVPSNRSGQSSPLTKGRSYSDASSSHDLGLKQRSPNQGHSRQANRTFEGRNETAKERSASDVSSRSTVSGSSQYSSLSGVSRLTSSTDVQTAVLNTGKTVDPAMLASQRKPSPQKSLAEEIQESLAAPGGAVDSGQMSGASDTYLTRDLLQTFNQGLAQNRAKPLTVRTVDQGRVGNALDSPSSVSDKRTSDSGMLSREGTMGTMTPQSSTSELSVKSQREWTSANGKAGSHDEDLTFSADEFGRKLEAALKATPLNTTFNLHDESSYDHTQDKQKSSSLTNIRVKSLPNGDSGFSSSTALCKNGPSSSSDGNLYLNPDSGYPFQNGPKLGNFANISGVLNSSLLSEGVIFRAEDLQDPELTKLPDFSLSSPTPGSPSNPRMQSTPVPTRMPSPMSLLSFMTSMEQGGGDELLSLLEMIGQQSEKLRTELEEAQVREAQLLDEIEELQAQQVSHPQEEAVDSRVLAKLSQEVEVLRMENRKLYREAANAHSEVSLQKHAAEELHATITRLQQELDHTSAENFHLLNRLKGGESNPEAVLYARTLPSKGLTYRRNQHPQDKGVQSSLSGSVRRSDQIIHAVVEQQASTNPHMSDLGVQVDVVEAKSLMDAEKLRKENLELKKTLAGLRYEREDLQDRLNSKNQDMASRLKELNLELQERREEISTAVSDNKNLLKERDEARTKVEEAEDRLKDAEACNEAASKNYEELEEKLRAKQKEVDSMTQELAELKLDGRKLRDKLETAELETCSLREQLNKSQNFSRQPGLSPTSSLALQRENVHLRQKLETAYEEIQVLKDALQLEDSTAGSVKSVDSVSSSASSMNAEKENLKLRHKLGLASNEIDSLREQLQFEQSLGTVPSTLSQGKLKEQENRKLKDKISSLTYELETLRDKLHRAEEPPSSSLEKDNAELRQELSAAKSEIQSLHATVERYKLNREEVQDSIKELETALEDAHKEQLVLQKEMMALKEQYSKVKKELKVTKKQNKDGRTYDSDSQSDVSVRSVPSSSSEYLPLPGDKDASSPYSKLYHKLRQTIEKTGPPASKGGVGLPSPFKVSQKEQDISVGGSRDGDRTSGGDADVKSRVIFTDSKTATTNADTTSSRDPFKTSDHYNEYSRDERRDNYSYSYLSRDGKVWDYDDQSEHSLKMSMLESQQTKLSKEAGDKVSTNDLDLMSSHSQEGNDDLQKTLEKYSRSWMSQGHYDSPSYSRIWDDQGDIAKNLDLEFKGSEGGEGGTGHRGRTDAVKNGDIEVETNSKASGADQWSYNDNVRSQKTEWNSGLPDVSDSLSDADMTAGYNADKMATIQWDGDYRTETVSLTDKKEAHVSSGVEETTDIPNGHLDDEVYCSQQDREDPKLKDKLPCVPVKVPEVLPDPSAPPQLTPEQRDYANSLIEKYLKMSPVRYSLQTTSSNPDSRTASGEEAAEK